MKKFIKIIAVILILSLLPINGTAVFTVSAAEATVTLCDLTDPQYIENAGFKVSEAHKKSGSYTALLSNVDLYLDKHMSVEQTDISDKEYIEFWVYLYSTEPSTAQYIPIMLSIVSDNDNTKYFDYYYAKIELINERGWQLVSLSMDNNFAAVGHPLGWQNIQSVNLWPYYAGNSPTPYSYLYFDKITASNTRQTDDYEEASFGKASGEYMIYDWSDPNSSANKFVADNLDFQCGVYSDDVSFSGSGTRKFNAENPFGNWWPELSFEENDFSEYRYLQMSVYSAYPSGLSMTYLLNSGEDQTVANGYKATVPVDWQGWKIITLDLEEMQRSPYGSPLGMDKITSFMTWITCDDITELYYDRVWLTNSPREQLPQKKFDYYKPYFVESTDDGYLLYDSPIALLKANSPSQQHPRLILTDSDFENIKSGVKANEFMNEAYKNVKAKADSYLNEPVYGWELNEVSQLTRNDIARFIPLALTYKITGDAKYKNRLWKEIESVCKFTNWNPYSDIDVGEYSRSVALMYDWMYNDFTDNQKLLMRNAMMRNGIAPMITMLRNRTSTFDPQQVGNHTPVTAAGLGMIALALGDEPGYEKVCNEVINIVPETMKPYLNTFDDGACPEGTTYWEYGLENTYLFQTAMMSALGIDYGIKDVTGQSLTGRYPVAVSTPANGTFNYGDAAYKPYAPSAMMIFAKTFNDPGVAAFRLSKADVVAPNEIDLMYYRPGMEEGSTDFPLDFCFNETNPIASMRSSYDSDAIYVGFKGGSNGYIGHNDLDKGSFVLEALGERWITDFGSEDYAKTGIFSVGDNGQRWTYYRKRAEGHNTLVINPYYNRGNITLDQDIEGKASIETFESNASSVYGIVDITSGYTNRIIGANIGSVKRGFALIDNRSRVIIQDEIVSSSSLDVYSFFHTDAVISIAPDGKSATLTKNGKSIKLRIASGGSATFTQMNAETMIDKYKGVDNSSNGSTKKLAIHLEGVTNATVSVVIDPVISGVTEKELPTFYELSSWNNY